MVKYIVNDNNIIYDEDLYNNIINGQLYITYDKKIYCHCVFKFKDTLKTLGFTYDGKYKAWYIKANEFNKDIFSKTQELRYMNNTTTGPVYYYYVYYKKKDELINHIEKKDKIQDEKKEINYLF